jgi:hypothetical protein
LPAPECCVTRSVRRVVAVAATSCSSRSCGGESNSPPGGARGKPQGVLARTTCNRL